MKTNKDDKNKAFGESEVLLREILAKELKEKLRKKIDEEDPQVINAIKQLLSEPDENA